MATYRDEDPLAAFMMRARTRALECIEQFANGQGAATISEARRILRALADAETQVLYPAFSRVALRLETQRLLDDSRDARAQQLAALEVLAHKRAARLRKLGAVALSDVIQHHAQQHISLLVPVLASQLPRPLYRSIVQAFMAHYERTLERAPSRRARPKTKETALAAS